MESILTIEEIQEGNKLMAEFIERYPKDADLSEYEDPVVLDIKYDGFSGVERSRTTRPFEYSDLEFHTNWNWLMNVINKIYQQPKEKFLGLSLTPNIDEQYRIVVSYLKYYNQNNPDTRKMSRAEFMKYKLFGETKESSL